MDSYEYTEYMFQVYSNVHQMLIDRHYTEIVSGKQTQTFDEFVKEYVKVGTLDKKAMNFVRMSVMKAKESCCVSVYFTTEESIGIKYIGKVSEKMMASKIAHCILVYPKSVTSSTKKYIEKSARLKIEAFAEDELFINVTKHKMTPLHQVLTPDEKKKFLSETRLTENQLARIPFYDPVAQYYGMKRGDVARIIRKSDTAGRYATFRICT